MNGTWSELAGAVESGLRAAAPVRVGIGPITAEPAAAWRRRNLYVTAVLMENTGPVPAPVAFRDLRGRWLAAAADVETLAPAGQEGSRGFLYLVSDRPYDDVLRPIAAGGSL